MFNNNKGNYKESQNERNKTEWQPASTYNHRHVGYYLKQARESFNLTIEEVSDTIRVRRLYLEAIEEGRYDQLPVTAYAVGFVRIYANFLGLNAARVVEQFRAETGPHQGEVEFEFEQAAPPIENHSMPKNIIVIVSVFVAILVLVVYLFFGRSRVETPVTDSSDIPTASQEQTQVTEENFPSIDDNTDNNEELNTDDDNLFDNLTLEGGDESQNQTGLLGNIPSNADGLSEDLTIEDLIEGNSILNSLDTNIEPQVERYNVRVNNYALPSNRGLEGWRNLSFVSIPLKPMDFGGNSQPQQTAAGDPYAPGALVTDVAGNNNGATENVDPLGVEPKLRILAKEDSYIYVFKQSDSSELRVGSLAAGSSYVIPEGSEVSLTYTGNVVVVVDGKYEVPINENSGRRSVLNYERLKQQAEILNSQ